jgi:glucokinase
MTYVVAADLGGTHIKSGLLSSTAELVGTSSSATPRSGGSASVIAALLETVSARVGECQAATGRLPGAVGVVVPGVVDEDRGVAVRSTNLGWRDVPLRSLLADQLGLPVALGHDVRAGGLAEATLGAGRGATSTLFVALGTGIAAAHVVAGQPQAGARWTAGELGHVVVDKSGSLCTCGQHGCLETIASAAAVERRYAGITGEEHITAEEVAGLVHTGVPAALQVWHNAVDALATALAMAVMLLDPEIIVIGGGLSRAGATLLDPLRASLAARFTFRQKPDVVAAQLGEWAGCWGAGLLGARYLEHTNIGPVAGEDRA